MTFYFTQHSLRNCFACLNAEYKTFNILETKKTKTTITKKKNLGGDTIITTVTSITTASNYHLST